MSEDDSTNPNDLNTDSPESPRRLWDSIKGFFRNLDDAHRSKAVGLTECEVRELENVFVLILMGSFTGLPAPPSFISAELLPHLEHELKVVNRRAENASDALAEIAGCFDVT